MLLGLLQLLIAQAAISVSIISTKVLITQLPILTLLCLRFGLGALFISGLLMFSGKAVYQPMRRISLSDGRLLIAQAICAGFLFNILMLAGLQYTSAAKAGMIASLLPMMMAVLSYLLLREQLSRTMGYAVFLATIGLVVLSMSGTANSEQVTSLVGDLLIFLALIPEALFTILAKWQKARIAPLLMAFIVNLINFLLFLPFMIYQLPIDIIASMNLAMVGLLGLFSLASVSFFFFWYKGLEKCTAQIAAISTGFMPVCTALLAVIFLNEPTSAALVVSLILVVAAIVVGARK